MESPSRHTPIRRAERWTAIALCAAVLAAGALEPFVRSRSAGAGTFAPDWAPLAAGALGAAGFISSNGRPRWARAPTGAAVERARADGVGSQWATVRSVPVDTPHPASRRLAGAGDQDAGLRRRGRARVDRRGAPGGFCINPSCDLVRLRRIRAGAALPGAQDVLGTGRDSRAQVARRRRPRLGAMAAGYPMAAGGRSVAAPRPNVALDAAPAVADRRLVCRRHRRHDRAGGLQVVRLQLVVGQRCQPRGYCASGSLVFSTAAGSSGRSPPAPPPARIRCAPLA